MPCPGTSILEIPPTSRCDAKYCDARRPLSAHDCTTRQVASGISAHSHRRGVDVLATGPIGIAIRTSTPHAGWPGLEDPRDSRRAYRPYYELRWQTQAANARRRTRCAMTIGHIEWCLAHSQRGRTDNHGASGARPCREPRNFLTLPCTRNSSTCSARQEEE